MNKKSTFLLFVVAAALLAFITFYETKQPGTREVLEKGANLVTLDPAKVRTITVTDGETVVALERSEDRWRVTKPVEDRADPAIAQQILGLAESIRKEQTIPAGDNKDAARSRISEVGLSSPKLKLEFGGDGAPPPILLGKEAAVEGKIYARLGDAQDIYVISDSILEMIRRKPEEFRDRRLSDLDPAKVVKVVVKSPGGEIEALREKERWRLVRPIKARADSARVTNLIAQMLNTSIESFVASSQGDTASQAFNDGRGSVALTPEGGGEVQMLEFGPETPADPSKITARFAVRKSVYTLAKESAAVLDTKPNDLRERKLARFDLDLVDRVTLASKAHGRTVLGRKGEDWTINPDKDGKGRAASRGDVNRLLDRLVGTDVRDFVADTASELAKYGLQDPSLRVTVSSYTAENTAEAKAGEHPIVTVAFGRSENGAVFARVEDEPFVVSVDQAVFDDIDRPAVGFREAPVLTGKAEEIRSFTLRKGEGIEVQAERGADGAWKSPGGGELAAKSVAVQSLVNVLANLRAVRWVAADPEPAHGFDKPALNVEFMHGSEKRRLTVGNPSPDGHRFARVSTTDGVFLINASDYSVLDLPIEAPAASTGGSPAPSPAVAPTTPDALSPAATPVGR